MSLAPTFPPLMQGRLAGAQPPFEAALRAAREGCDAGLILYDPGPAALEAAIVLAPEVPLAEAMTMLPLCGVSLQNALGALGPSELAVQLGWFGEIVVNGASAGRLRAAASTADPAAQPDWLVVGLSLDFVPEGDGGDTPDRTALYAEGCGDLTPEQVLESWSRHLLTGIHRWEDEGIAALHRDYSGLVHGLGDPMRHGGESGTFLGLDERLGLLFKTAGGTRLLPLTQLLEEGRP
ncbi:biotin/lipoate--protein ligase family protein [Aestuariicoccus sp. MJ-SS9]|uniref:biotin/lipoate--protein ligase family protein n=1 Tax=Aestuariicoccus sp. MJ-SS9 TaxID=3079855 RepID=UPI0029141C4F|nr:DUF4444 domain-containing protein [Aestuariicoccus sp. MJ-SS9]MDU8912431.1 DUF4444 domain-containing protein [Aestuariicoccus sp. MJ-SS9]